jgi:type II secretory pathway component PulM
VELLAKLGDAASMFWQSLDERERLIVLYGVFALALAVELLGHADRERRREQRLLDRLEERIHAR